MNGDTSEAARAKAALRRGLIADRKNRSSADRVAAASANSRHLLTALAGARTVCGYLPLASEPLHIDLLDALVAAGSTVLVPVVSADSALDWCVHPGPTAPGAFGIAEPAGDRLGPSAVTRADVVLVPALAVDWDGRRLGRGGGHYDRTLALLDPGSAELIAVLFDGELLEHVPTGPHDMGVTSVVQPAGGLQRLRR